MQKFNHTLLAAALMLSSSYALAQDEAANPTITQNQQSLSTAQTNTITNLQSQYYKSSVTSANFGSTQDALNYIAGAINLLINYAYTSLTTLMYTQTYDAAQAQANGAVQQSIVSTVDTNFSAIGLKPYTSDAQPTPPYLTGQAILDTLTVTNPTTTQLVLTTTIPASLYSMQPCTGVGTAVTSSNTNCSNNSSQTYTSSFNLNSLIGYSFYSSAQQQTALNFVQFASGLAEPIATLDMTKCTGSCLNKPAIAKYLASLRAYAAKQSVGISALYQMFAQRNLLTKDSNGNAIHLGQIAGLPTTSPNYPDASPAQVEYYSASRRINDPNWFAAMETANDTTLARENLYIQAENRMEMFKMRQDIERLTAIIAILQLEVLKGLQAPTAGGDTIKSQVDSLSKNPPFSSKSGS